MKNTELKIICLTEEQFEEIHNEAFAEFLDELGNVKGGGGVFLTMICANFISILQRKLFKKEN